MRWNLAGGTEGGGWKKRVGEERVGEEGVMRKLNFLNNNYELRDPGQTNAPPDNPAERAETAGAALA